MTKAFILLSSFYLLCLHAFSQESYNPIQVEKMANVAQDVKVHTEDFSSPDQYRLETPQYARGLASQMYYEEVDAETEESSRAPQAVNPDMPAKKKIKRPSSQVPKQKIPKNADAADLRWNFEAQE